MPKRTLSDAIAELANPTPVFRDPEEVVNNLTAARLVEKDDIDEEGNTAQNFSHLRRKNVPLLEDFDKRYAGKKISRKKLKEQHGDISDEDIESEEDEDDGPQDELPSDDDLDHFRKRFKTKKVKKRSFEDKKTEKLEDTSGEEVMDDESQDEDEDSEEEEEDGGRREEEEEAEDKEEEEGKDGVKKFSSRNVQDEIEKGMAAKAQLGLWDNILECRIQLQKVMLAANQLPQADMFRKFEEAGNEDYKTEVTSGQSAAKMLIDKLLELQELLLQKYPETRHVITGDKGKQQQPASDEEIPSDTDEEKEEISSKMQQSPRKKLKDCDYPVILAERHKNFQPYRNKTIQKWNEKTRVSVGKINTKSFSSFEQSTLKQIEQILSNKPRLIKRTQLKRTDFRVLGTSEVDDNEDAEDDANIKVSDDQDVGSKVDHERDYDIEIFDDNDFYHHLLRELIERKTADMTDPGEITRKWFEIQQLRSKRKKDIKCRIGRDRMLNYDVHAKLVNFMVPIPKGTMTDDAQDELFSSLFGNTQLI